MDKQISEIIRQLPPMLDGKNLKEKMQVFPKYDSDIRKGTVAARLMALEDIYKIYIPSTMSIEIYSKLYLAVVHSLQKKSSRDVVEQGYRNMGRIQNAERMNLYGVIGGADSFTIIGESGIGKSSAIARSIQLATANCIIELEEPYCKLIPCIIVQAPFDCSVKGLLLQILKQVDAAIDSKYYDVALRSRATIDMLIGSVSQVCMNHTALLIVDEIQNVVGHRQGAGLVGCLTQLINNSGISICMVGTPEAEDFFEKVNYLARRALGLRYTTMEYNTYFKSFCKTMFSYQYVKELTKISEADIQWLYEHSGGILAIVVSLIHDAQELSILDGTEKLDINSLNKAYEQRMGMLHMHIRPKVNIASTVVHKKGRTTSENVVGIKNLQTDKKELQSTLKTDDNSMSNKFAISDDWSIPELVEQAKREQLDIVDLIRTKVSVTKVSM